MSNRVYSKPVDTFKMLPTDGLTGQELIATERLNFSRKVVNLRGGINKAHRAYNRNATKQIGLSTFVRYHSLGANGDKVIRFVLNDY